MVSPVNTKDVLLQATSPRLNAVGYGIILSPSSTVVQRNESSDVPSVITINAALEQTGSTTINWTTTPNPGTPTYYGTLSNGTKTLTINTSDIPVTGMTVTAQATLKTVSYSNSIGLSVSPAVVYKVEPSSLAIVRTSTTAFSPSTVTFYSYKTGLTKQSYIGRFKIYENGSATASYTSAAGGEVSKVYTPSSSCFSIQVELYDLTLTTLLDVGSVAVLSAGGQAAVLSNPAHVFTASNAGVVSSYAGSGTDITVYDGSVPMTFYSSVQTTKGTWWLTSTPTGTNITAGAVSGSGTNKATVAAASAMTADTANIVYSGSGITYNGVAFSGTIQQNFSKSLGGATGGIGLSAIDVVYTNTSVPVPISSSGTITWTGTGGVLQVYDGSTILTLSSNTQSTTTPGTNGQYVLDITAVSGDTLTEPTITGSGTTTATIGNWAGTLTQLTTYRITAYVKSSAGNTYTLSTDVSIAPVRDGTAAVDLSYSNNTLAVPVTNTGTATWTGTGGSLTVYDGSTALTLSSNTQSTTTPGTNGQYVLDITAVSGNTLTEPTITGSGTTTATIGNWAGTLTQLTTYRITAYILTSTGVSTTRVLDITIAPAKQGLDGADGITPDVSTYLTRDATSILTGSGGIKAGTITWNTTTGAITGGSGVALTSKGILGAVSGSATFTLTDAGAATFKGDIVTGGDAQFSGKSTSTRTITISGTSYSVDYSSWADAASSATSASYARVGSIGYASATTSAYDIGLIGKAPSTTKGFGVVGEGGIGNLFISTTSGSAAVLARNTAGGVGVYSEGSITSTGNITAYSDIRLKTDIKRISDALNKVKSLNGYTYKRIDSGELQTGLSAQEVQLVAPEAVNSDKEYLSVAYGNLVGLLVEAIKELDSKVDDLTKKLEDRYK